MRSLKMCGHSDEVQPGDKQDTRDLQKYKQTLRRRLNFTHTNRSGYSLYCNKVVHDISH